jgi:hypothetical protein
MKAPIQNVSSFDFMHAELSTGLTFARVASTAKYANRAARNLANARKAFDTAVSYMARVPLSTTEFAELEGKLAELKQELQQLGVSF